ncbi:MAG: hypothetical protein KGV56_01685 [Gammaproteobacteria bacterium]|nr:hypothetical protein [Gammaproteobacteria bacterium]
MNTNNINEKKSQKIAIALFSTSLLCLALVLLLSGNIYVSNKRQAVPPQHTEWILSTESSEVASVSNIDFIAPKQDHFHLNIDFKIEEREDIKVADESCYDDCNKIFDISKLQSSMKNKTLTLDFTQTIVDKNHQNYEHKRIVIKLPNKDWNFKCINDNVLTCKTIRNQSKQPINLTLTSDYGIDIYGNFNQLTLWQLSGRSHDIESGNINNLTIYSPNASLDISDTKINQIDIHSDSKGYFRIEDLSLLDRTTLQPLTDAEREKITQLTPLSVCGKCESDKHP